MSAEDYFGPYRAPQTVWYFGRFVRLRNQEQKSEELLVLQGGSSISSRAGGQLTRFLK